jgi:hypothetical protein
MALQRWRQTDWKAQGTHVLTSSLGVFNNSGIAPAAQREESDDPSNPA